MPFYHGTAREDAFREIVRTGIIRPGNDGGRKGYMAPIPHRTYVSRDLSYALMYAAGGDLFGADESGLKKFAQHNGVIGGILECEIDRAKCWPDEDFIGAAICESRVVLRNRAPARNLMKWLGPHVPKAIDKAATLDEMKLLDVAQHARIGKIAIKELAKNNPSMLDTLLDYAPWWSQEGNVKVLKAWMFAKIDMSRIRRQYADDDFFLYAREVSVGRENLHLWEK